VDADRITELRTWATRLEERATNEETHAAAKAILLLAEEVEDLQAKLVVATAAAAPAADEPEPADAPTPAAGAPAPEADDRLSGSFFSRLKRTFGFE
jgi:hypothetical protein